MKYLFLILFAAAMLVVAFISVRKTKTLSDFMLGGRRIGPWLSAFAYGTTYFSAVIFIGYAGRNGWNFGLSSVWIGLGNALIGALAAWLFLAQRTRTLSREWNVKTIPEFLEKRYGSRGLKVAVALIIFVFLTPYTASVYQGLGYLFERAFNLPYAWCMAGMAAVTAIYLLAGGYMASVWTDFIQGILMIGGVVALVICLFSALGGVSNAFALLSAQDPLLTAPVGPGGFTPLLSLILLTSFGTWGMPQMMQKFYAIRDDAAVKRGTIISTVFALVIGCGAYLCGSLGRVFLDGAVPVDPTTGLQSYDMVVPEMLMRAVPDVLIGLILVLVLSASMSTLSSLVMTSSSAIAVDLCQGALFPRMKQRQVMILMRLLCVAFVGISLLIALSRQAAILTLMNLSWGTVAGAILGPYLWGLIGKRVNRAGAWFGSMLGAGTSVLLAFTWGMEHSAQIGIIAMAVSFAAVPLVSLAAGKRPAAPSAGSGRTS